MSEFYQATFRWPHRDASNVIVTGSFDGWSCTRYLSRSNSGFFEGIVQISWGEKVAYKYIVDGRWTTTDDRPTEMDNEGNLNNVFRAPARPEPQLKPEPAPEPETETETDTERTETDTEASSVSAAGAVGAVTAAATGVVETARQAAVSMVEALAPGTTETPAETPAAETPRPELTPKLEPAPAPAPEPSQADAAATEVANTVVLSSEPTHVAPQVRVALLPLIEPSSDAAPAPAADVSESHPLDKAVVESATTSDAPSNVPASAPAVPEGEPSTHVPAPVNGASEEKLVKIAPVEDTAPVNGSSTNGTDQPKPAGANGTAEPPKPTAVNGAEKVAPVNGTTTTTPTKEKKMRFPSLSSRSLRHPRRRSSGGETSAASTNELGERNGQETNDNGKDTVSSRFASSQRQKRTSLFGKLKDVFSHPKNESST